MCNVKHHRCQLGNLGPGLAPIHKSRRLGRRAGPMWIENGVASGPPDAGGGWPGWAAARKAQQPSRAQPEQRRVCGPGLGFGSRIAGPNGESESATSRLSCARMALGRSSTGLCSPTTTCTQATHTTTGRPRASRRPLCPPRASLSSTL